MKKLIFTFIFMFTIASFGSINSKANYSSPTMLPPEPMECFWGGCAESPQMCFNTSEMEKEIGRPINNEDRVWLIDTMYDMFCVD